MGFLDGFNSRKNIWNTNPSPNPSDIYLFAIFFFITIAFFDGFLTSTNILNYGTIYFYLALLIFTLFGIALGTKRKVNTWEIYGVIKSNYQFFILAGIGILTYYVATSATTIFLSPLLQSQLSVGIPITFSAGANVTNTNPTTNLTNYSVISFYAPLAEELFTFGVLFASIRIFRKRTNGGSNAFASGFVITGAVIFLLAVLFLGTVGYLICIVFFLMALLSTIKPFSTTLNKLPIYIVVLIDLSLVVFAILALHIFSYGNPVQNFNLFISAGFFFLVEGVVDYLFQSIIPSIMAHTMNNVLAGVSLFAIQPLVILGLAIPISIISIVIMILFLYIAFRLKYIAGIGAAQISPEKYTTGLQGGVVR